MRHRPSALLAGLLLLATSVLLPAQAQDATSAEVVDPVAELPWQLGPTTAAIGERATIEVPEGYAFLGAEGTREFNELMENPPTGVDEYTLAPLDLGWAAYFSFDDIGYVKDDETLESDGILESIREGTNQANVEREARGWNPLHILGWSFEPRYDEQLKLLEWAVLAESGGSQVVNYNTRLLGRRGVMEVILVASPDTLQASIADFKGLVPGYAFAPGETYAEYREGDHVAEYGLAALITGGAAAVAAKKGWLAAIGLFLAKMWKLILVGLVAVGAVARKLFTRRGHDRQP